MRMNWIIFISIFILVILAIIFGPNAWRLYKVANLFDKNTISYNFINMKEFFPTSTPIKASENPHIFKKEMIFICQNSMNLVGRKTDSRSYRLLQYRWINDFERRRSFIRKLLE